MIKIDLEKKYLVIIREILKKCLPESAQVWVFGSRAKGTAKKYSDVDLAIDIGGAISLELAAKLHEAFSESDLPYKVDVVDVHSIDQSFRDNINENKILLELKR